MGEAYRMPKAGEVWRHFEGGPNSLYEIVGLGTDTESEKPVVIYRPCGSQWFRDPPLHVSALSAFLASVEKPEGYVPRFWREHPASPMHHEEEELTWGHGSAAEAQ